jgi:hypothetical protein
VRDDLKRSFDQVFRTHGAALNRLDPTGWRLVFLRHVRELTRLRSTREEIGVR